MKPVVTIITLIIGFHLNHPESWAFSLSDSPPGLQFQHSQSLLASKKEKKEKEKKDQKEDTPSPGHSEKTLTSLNLTLKLAFMADPRLFPYDLDCHVHDDMVELTGVVSREEEKAVVTHITSHVMTGKEIQNNIEVHPSLMATIQTTADIRLTELVKQRFTKSQTLRETNFEVSTLRGVVSLKGRTRFQVIALEAAQAAREIPGVNAVNTENVQIEAADE